MFSESRTSKHYAEIIKAHARLREIDLFPAVPAPVAALCGRETLPKVHPAPRVYDCDKGHGDFRYQLTVNAWHENFQPSRFFAVQETGG